MSKHLQLQVPDACHENWEKMTRAEKGRFCGSCQKQVIDFTNMSDRDLVAFFKKPAASVCGRFRPDQLDREIDIPKKRIPWVKYFFQFTLPAFLISMKATSQTCRIQGKLIATCTKKIMGDTELVKVCRVKVEKPIPFEVTEIKGRIVDGNGNGLPGGTIVVKGTNESDFSDASGNFIFKIKKDKVPQILVASYVGYLSKEINLWGEHLSNQKGILEIKMEASVMGETVKVVRVGYSIQSPQKKIPLIMKIFQDTAFNNFKVYPNPAQVGSQLHFEFKKPVPGIYSIQLFTQTGQLIHSEEIESNEKNQLISVRVPSAIAGTYFIRMRNKKTGKEYPEKIVIQ